MKCALRRRAVYNDLSLGPHSPGDCVPGGSVHRHQQKYGTMSNDSETGAGAPGSVVNRAIQSTIAPAKFPPIYTNFVSISGAPEEIIFDFGLNTDPMGQSNSPVKLSHRLVMSHYTAKRLAIVLQACLARQEAVFGVVDTDIARRIAMEAGKSAANKKDA